MPDLTSLAQYGLTGVAIGIIILFAYFMFLVFKFAGNHLKHLTNSINSVNDTLKEVIFYFKKTNGK